MQPAHYELNIESRSSIKYLNESKTSLSNFVSFTDNIIVYV